MAPVGTAAKDVAAKRILGQTNTKTVGAPPSATGLTGDLAPASIFTVSDYEAVKNQVHLEPNNVGALDLLRLLGDITGMRSSSGPIPNTQQCISVTDTAGSGNPTGDIFVPKNGECWQLVTAEWMTANATNARLRIEDTGNDVAIQISLISGAGVFTEMDSPVMVSHPCKLVYQFVGSSGDNKVGASLVRVR